MALHGSLSSACALAAVATLLSATVPALELPEPGSITGHVRLTKAHGAPLPSNVYSPRAVSPHDGPSTPEIRNVVVYLKDTAYRGALPTSHQSIRQEHESFTPRVLAITKGSTVEFPNDDPFFHNVFSLSSAATFDLGHYKQGESRSVKFLKTGLVKVYCHVHSQMSASILVLDDPYFAVPSDEGIFTIANVPAGRYTIVGWHERVGERTLTVDVEPGKTASVELSLPVGDAP